ncbi:hypothetical protein [Dyella sp.]|uniref:hypothetical protein n=1 Tax=Dyella sp. TaxID=1869338 RepID=UPI002ED19F25
MFRHSLTPFRRSRAMLAWALCAWLALVNMAWAQPDCCAGMHAQPSAHGQMHRQAHDHDGMAPADCLCAHAPAALPEWPAWGLASAVPASLMPQLRSFPLPWAAHTPPWRPPAVTSIT